MDDWQDFLTQEAKAHELTPIQIETLKAMYPTYDSDLTVSDIFRKLNITKATYDGVYRARGIYEKFEESSEELRELRNKKGKESKYTKGKYAALRTYLRKKFLEIDKLWEELQKQGEYFKMGAIKAELDRGCILSITDEINDSHNSPFYREVRLGDTIQIQINLEQPSNYVMVLEKGVSGDYGLLCPSIIASNSYQEKKTVILPQEKIEAFPMKYKGTVEQLAIITKNQLNFNWVLKFDNKTPFLRLSKQHLQDLIHCLEKEKESKVLRHEFIIS